MNTTARYTLGDVLEISLPATWLRMHGDTELGFTFNTPTGIIVRFVAFPVDNPRAPAFAKWVVEHEFPGLVEKFRTGKIGEADILEAVFPDLGDGSRPGCILVCKGQAGIALYFRGTVETGPVIEPEINAVLESIRFLGGRVPLVKESWRLGPTPGGAEARRAIEYASEGRAEPKVRVQVPRSWKEIMPEEAKPFRLALGSEGYIQRFEIVADRERDPERVLTALVPSTLEAGDSFAITEFRHARGYLGRRLKALIRGTAIRAAAFDSSVYTVLASLVGPVEKEVEALFEQVLASLELLEHEPIHFAIDVLRRRHTKLTFAKARDRLVYVEPGSDVAIGEVFLGNFEGAQKLLPDQPLTAALQYLDAVVICVLVPRPDFVPDHSRIWPYVTTKRMLPLNAKFDGAISLPFERDLHFVFVAEADGRVCPITEQMAAAAGLEPVEVAAHAYANLCVRMSAQAPFVIKNKDGKVAILIWHECPFVGGLLSVPKSVHKHHAELLGERFLAAVPSSHDLVLFVEGDQGVMEEAAEIVADFKGVSPHPATETIFEVTADGMRRLGARALKRRARR